ncbi:HopJ type III effector protein [Pseudomonas aeruginosa]|uniref:HopJ type III effector protein n=1 Tax=Pseudomonas aeruginosa TaxID=287 RepID=UPI002222918E|nr:HopJ type III effector protein [Pseudomonas aeruginosa]
MTLTDFRARLRSEHHLFTDTLAFIAEHYSYTPSAFDNGSVSNPAGQNEGSCKTLGFAILEGLSLEETLLAFGEHYRAIFFAIASALESSKIKAFRHHDSPEFASIGTKTGT